MNVTQIFCDADGFCQGFIPSWEKTRLESEENTRTRIRTRSVCETRCSSFLKPIVETVAYKSKNNDLLQVVLLFAID
jgi:hypothetical protein